MKVAAIHDGRDGDAVLDEIFAESQLLVRRIDGERDVVDGAEAVLCGDGAGVVQDIDEVTWRVVAGHHAADASAAGGNGAGETKTDEKVVDAEFEEVDKDKK